MLTEDRDGAFWSRIAAHPAVEPHVCLGQTVDMAAFVAHPAVTALRSEHGGFLFVALDACRYVQELHTLFTPEGWGREVLLGAKAAAAEMFDRGAQMIVTHEVEGWKRSQPPRSFGFTPAADFATHPLGSFRMWVLTRTAWSRAPANRG